MNKEIRFSFTTSSLEVYKDDEGVSHIRAVASDSLEDLQGDVITETCIKQMSDQVSNNSIPLLPDHRASFEIGKSYQGDTRRNPETKGLELVTDFSLDDDYTEARKLFKEVQAGTCKRQLSIGGFLNKNNPRAAYLDERNGKIVTVLDDIILDHIAVTREGRAANPRTNFISAVVKAIDEAGYEISKEGLVERPDTEKENGAEEAQPLMLLPAQVVELGGKYLDVWKRVWKDTFVRQVWQKRQSVDQAVVAATGVAISLLAKQTGGRIILQAENCAVERSEAQTIVLGTTSKAEDGHTHLWAAREVGEKILDGLMLTVKGHDHTILETGKCDSDSEHEHTMIRRDRKVAEPSTEHSAPVGLLYFGKGFGSKKDVQTFLDANGIAPTNITPVANSTYMVEFSIDPLTGPESESPEKEAEMPKGGEVEKVTVTYKGYPLSDERGWTWDAATGNALLGDDGDNWARFKSAHTYFDNSEETDSDTKGAYSLPHHKLDDETMKTYLGGVIAATAVLNGARGGFRRDTSEAGRKSLYNHLAKHYAQADRKAPPLKIKWLDRTKEDFSHPNPATLCERDFEDFVFALELGGFKDNLPEFLNKEWWMTWDADVTGVEDIPECEKSAWCIVEKSEEAPAEEPKDADKEEPEASEQEAEAKVAKDQDGGNNDDKPTEPPAAEEAPAEDGGAVDPIQTAIKELATSTQSALVTITDAVSSIGKRVEALEGKTEKDEPAPEAPVEEKPAETPKVEEKPAEEKPAEAKPEETAPEKRADDKPDTTKEEKPSEAKPSDLFTAFHAVLEGLGMTAKEFTDAMAQKSLDSVGPNLTEAVQKAVEASVGTLQNGVKQEVEKALDGKIETALDEKLVEVTKAFQGIIEKLDGRVTRVEDVGGVPGGAAGQEGSDDAADKPKSMFAGLFSGALKGIKAK